MHLPILTDTIHQNGTKLGVAGLALDGAVPFAEIGRDLTVTGVDPDTDVLWKTARGETLATGRFYVATSAHDGAELYVSVTGQGGQSWDSPLFAVRQAPPALIDDPYPEILDVGDEAEEIPLAGYFSGKALRFSTPDNVLIDAEKGVVQIPTADPVSRGEIRVRAENSGGAVEAVLHYVVEDSPFRQVSFGALTCAGHGACVIATPPGRLVADSGTGLGLTQIGLAPSRTGVGRGQLEFSSGLLVMAAVIQNEFSVANAAEVEAALRKAPKGATVRLRASAKDISLGLRNLNLDGVVLTGETGSSVKSIVLDRCSGLTLRDLNIRNDNSSGADFKSGDGFYACVIRNCRDIRIDRCRFDCDPTQSGSRQPLQSLRRRFGGVRATRSDLRVTDCYFQRVRDGIVANLGSAIIERCVFRQIYEDAITGLHTHWQVDDNVATLFEGSYVRDFPGQASGSLTPGRVLRTDDGRNVMEVVALTANGLRAQVNNYNLPRNGQVLSDASGNSFRVTGRPKEARGLNIHGDFFQPILLKDSPGNCQVIARRNVVFRSTPYTLGQVAQEPNSQGLLVQRNGGPHFHAPCEITHNVVATGQPIGIRAFFCADGIVANNTVLWSEVGYGSDLEIRGGRNLRVELNAGDNSKGGAVDDRGGHQNVTVARNVTLSGRNLASEINAPFSYPQTLAGLAPRRGGQLDQSGAGALTADGTFRR